jgi:hypothetical protein
MMPQTIDAIIFACADTDPSQWPELSCGGAHQLALQNGILRLAIDRELFFQDNGQIRSFDDTHKLVFDRTNNRLELHEAGAIRFLTGTPVPTERMRIQADGAIGIGEVAPGAGYKLDVQGSLRVSGDLDIDGAVAGRNIAADGETLDTHVARRDNPHEVTAADVGAPGIATGLVQKSEFVLENVPGASKGDEGRATSMISHGLGPVPVALTLGLEDFGENPGPPHFERAVDRYYAFRDTGISASAFHIVAEVTKPYDGTFKLFTNVGSMEFFDRVRWWALSLGT